MPFKYDEIVIRDFTGGITDNYINANKNQYEIADNYLINDNGLELRSGNHVIYDSESLQRIMGLFAMNDDLFVIRGASFYRFNLGALDIIQPPSLSSFFPVENDQSYPSASEWRNQLHVTNKGVGNIYNRPMRVWKNDLNVFETVELGLPAFDGSGVLFTPTAVGATFNYLYAIIYEYTYKVGDTTFKNVSTVFQEAVTTGTAIGASSVNITNLPILNEARLDNSVIIKGIYRTQHNGTVFRKVGDVNNATTIFTDNIPDATTWADGILLYTDGGLVQHSQAPKCKYMMIVNDIAYYMNVIEELSTGEELRPYRFVQSIPNAPSAVDETFFEDLDDDIIGGAHVKGLPIIFTKSFIYRIEGRLNVDGTGTIRKRVISDTIGCVSHNGIVRTGQGIFFAGLHGFYVTDGYTYRSLTAEKLDDSYQKLVDTIAQGERIVGTYDQKNERILWACSDTTAENDLEWVLDLKSLNFTKINGIEMFFTHILYKDGNILRGDEQGFIYEFDDDDATDVRREFGVPSADWQTERIPYKYKSAAIDGGNPHIRKWGHEMTISIKSNVPAALKLTSNNDDGEKIKVMKEIRLSGSWIWRDPNFVWRNPEFVWRLAETQSSQRRFPRGSARFRRKQVQIEPARTNLFKSDNIDLADASYVDAGDPNEFYIDIPITTKWPTNILLDFITFEDTDYVVEHQIVERVTDNRLRITGGTLFPGTDKKWVIKGFKRPQRMEIKALSITMAPMDNTGGDYKTSESGENS